MTIDLETLPTGWGYAEVTIRHGNGDVSAPRLEVIDLRSQSFYPPDSMTVIACKCAALFWIGIPLYMGAYTIFHLLRLPLATIRNLSPKVFYKELWKLVQIPFYLIALEFAALYGLFKPLEGRILIGRIENSLHDGKGRQSDCRKKELPLLPLMYSFIEKENKHPFYLAFCMQSLGRKGDPHIVDATLLPNPSSRLISR